MILVFTLNVISQLTLPVLLTVPILLPMQLPLNLHLYCPSNTDNPVLIGLHQRLRIYASRPLLMWTLTNTSRCRERRLFCSRAIWRTEPLSFRKKWLTWSIVHYHIWRTWSRRLCTIIWSCTHGQDSWLWPLSCGLQRILLIEVKGSWQWGPNFNEDRIVLSVLAALDIVLTFWWESQQEVI